MPAIGIDIGGTFIKGALLSGGEVVEDVVRRPIPGFLSIDGPAREIDAELLMAGVREVLGSVGEASSIWVTGQMASIAFVDDQGKACAPVVSWQDERSGSVDQVRALLGDDAVAATGDGLRPALPLVRLSALGLPPGSFLTSLLAFVAGSLSDRRAGVVHLTDAAAWGLVDLLSGRWSRPALDALGIDAADLPAITANFVPVGVEVVSGAPVMVAVADQQASLLGAGVGYGEYADCVSVNLATGCQVSVVSGEPSSRAQLRPYFDDMWLHTVTHLPAGRLLTAAVLQETGGVGPEHWLLAAELASSPGPVQESVRTIVDAITDSVRVVGAEGRAVRFSGGLVQQFSPLQDAITAELGVSSSSFDGDDAALAGLAVLADRSQS